MKSLLIIGFIFFIFNWSQSSFALQIESGLICMDASVCKPPTNTQQLCELKKMSCLASLKDIKDPKEEERLKDHIVSCDLQVQCVPRDFSKMISGCRGLLPEKWDKINSGILALKEGLKKKFLSCITGRSQGEDIKMQNWNTLVNSSAFKSCLFDKRFKIPDLNLTLDSMVENLKSGYYQILNWTDKTKFDIIESVEKNCGHLKKETLDREKCLFQSTINSLLESFEIPYQTLGFDSLTKYAIEYSEKMVQLILIKPRQHQELSGCFDEVGTGIEFCVFLAGSTLLGGELILDAPLPTQFGEKMVKKELVELADDTAALIVKEEDNILKHTVSHARVLPYIEHYQEHVYSGKYQDYLDKIRIRSNNIKEKISQFISKDSETMARLSYRNQMQFFKSNCLSERKNKNSECQSILKGICDFDVISNSNAYQKEIKNANDNKAKEKLIQDHKKSCIKDPLRYFPNEARNIYLKIGAPEKKLIKTSCKPRSKWVDDDMHVGCVKAIEQVCRRITRNSVDYEQCFYNAKYYWDENQNDLPITPEDLENDEDGEYFDMAEFKKNKTRINYEEFFRQLSQVKENYNDYENKSLNEKLSKVLTKENQTYVNKLQIKSQDLIHKIMAIKNPSDLLAVSSANRVEFASGFQNRFLNSLTEACVSRSDKTNKGDLTLVGICDSFKTSICKESKVWGCREKITKCLSFNCDLGQLCGALGLVKAEECTIEHTSAILANVHHDFLGRVIGDENIDSINRMMKQTSVWAQNQFAVLEKTIIPNIQFVPPDFADLPNVIGEVRKITTPPIEVKLIESPSENYSKYHLTYTNESGKFRVTIGVCKKTPCSRGPKEKPASEGEILSIAPECGPGVYSIPKYPDILRQNKPKEANYPENLCK